MNGSEDGYVHSALVAARRLKASDLHLSVNQVPALRINGDIVRPADDEKYTSACDQFPILREKANASAIKFFVRSLAEGGSGLTTGVAPNLATDGTVDVSVDGKEEFGPVRVHGFAELSGERLAIRLLAEEVPSYESLGLPPELKIAAEQLSGLIMFVGPTGSGKTTGQVSLLQGIADNDPVHIMTAEDPVEYRLRGRRAIVSQIEVGVTGHVRDHRDALRDILRSDPDVLMLQEARTPDALHAAIELAEQGRMVLTSVHSRDAQSTPDRIIGAFPGDMQPQVRQQLANALTAIIVLRLVPRKDGHGRVAAFELCIATDGIRSNIRDGETQHIRNAISSGRKEGMITLERSLANLALAGTIDKAVAERYAIRRDEFHRDFAAGREQVGDAGDTTSGRPPRKTAFG